MGVDCLVVLWLTGMLKDNPVVGKKDRNATFRKLNDRIVASFRNVGFARIFGQFLLHSGRKVNNPGVFGTQCTFLELASKLIFPRLNSQIMEEPDINKEIQAPGGWHNQRLASRVKGGRIKGGVSPYLNSPTRFVRCDLVAGHIHRKQ
jgi:hypothetical protein